MFCHKIHCILCFLLQTCLCFGILSCKEIKRLKLHCSFHSSCKLKVLISHVCSYSGYRSHRLQTLYYKKLKFVPIFKWCMYNLSDKTTSYLSNKYATFEMPNRLMALEFRLRLPFTEHWDGLLSPHQQSVRALPKIYRLIC